MNCGVFLQGDNADYFRMGKLTIESVHDTMPGVDVVHFTDANTPMLEGADSVRRITEHLPMAVRRMMHNANVLGDWLFIDCDVIVQKDVRDVFEQDFDVALTDRIGTDMEGTSYGAVMPINLGVAFSRSPAFWNRVRYHLGTLSPKLQEWCGDQLVVCEMIKQRVISDFKVNILPGKIYNFPPVAADDQHSVEAAILHFKGARKQKLLEKAA